MGIGNCVVMCQEMIGRKSLENFIDRAWRRGLDFLINVCADKIKSLNELIPIVRRLKGEGKRIVFTNGCFDLIHTGHIRLLKMARSRGDCLIVALNTDESVRKIKGDQRPILDQRQRGYIVASFEPVSFVLFFEEETPDEAIRQIQPDVLVKGGEYNMDEVVGRQTVWESCGEVTVVNPFEGRSSSGIVEEIVRRFSNKK